MDRQRDDKMTIMGIEGSERSSKDVIRSTLRDT